MDNDIKNCEVFNDVNIGNCFYIEDANYIYN